MGARFMEDLVKTLVNAPTNAVLVLAGLAFLAVAVFGRVTDRLDPGPKGRIGSGLLGIALLALGLLLPSDNHGSGQTAANSAPSTPAAPSSPSSASNAGATTTPAEPVPASNTDKGDAAISAPPRSDSSITLAAGQVVKRDNRTYTILKMQFEGGEANDLALEVTARMVNESSYPANFWNDNFRLVVDDVPNAPVGSLNELVDGHAAKEGVVKFALRPDAKTAVLQIDRFGSDAPGITIPLPQK
jgi:hypothetical protein